MIVKHKLFFAWNMQEEKLWLEEQAKKGLILKDVGFYRYVFEQQEPQDLVYDFDFQILKKKDEEEYLELFHDWKLVKRFGSWYYFVKYRANDESDLIYNDNHSRKLMLRRLIVILAIIGFPLYYQLIIFFPNLDNSRFAYPAFYFFFRIIVIILVALHALAMIKLILSLKKLNKAIKE